MLFARVPLLVAGGALICALAGATTAPADAVAGKLAYQVQGTGAPLAAPASHSSAAGISADGRIVAFNSDASNLVAGDTNNAQDVFVRDRVAGTTERMNVRTGGAQANNSSSAVGISADGRFVAFYSDASNLVAGDTNDSQDVFVRDRVAGTTERVSVSSAGAQANNVDFTFSVGGISADGRFVVFDSTASNLVAGDTNNSEDVFVRDRLASTTERVSVSTAGPEANDGSFAAGITADGRFVAFDSAASNLVLGDTNKSFDMFVHDRLAGTTERASVSSGGAQANGGSSATTGAISADGRFVAFASRASNLVVGDTNNGRDVFVRDRVAGTTERVSVSSAGAQANNVDLDRLSDTGLGGISADGRFVVFTSEASNLVAGDTNSRTRRLRARPGRRDNRASEREHSRSASREQRGLRQR